MKRRGACVLTLLALLSCGARAGEISIAVASNFTATLHAIAAEFEKATGHEIRAASGSSGKFYAQIKNGAPFQVFLSADEAKPLRLEQDGLAVPGTRFTYAIGRLALWSARSGFIDGEGMVLRQGHFDKLAIANPGHAPYGAAALDALQGLGLDSRMRGRLVQAENIAQAYQFVESGNAELGFVALAQIVDAGGIKQGSAWIVPAELHRPIRQDAVLLQAGAHNAAARELLTFMRGETAQSIIAAHGYQTGAAP